MREGKRQTGYVGEAVQITCMGGGRGKRLRSGGGEVDSLLLEGDMWTAWASRLWESETAKECGERRAAHHVGCLPLSFPKGRGEWRGISLRRGDEKQTIYMGRGYVYSPRGEAESRVRGKGRDG